MEQFAKLLFATTVITIFALIVMFFFVDLPGNGGQYWGYDGHDEAYVAASRAFDSGDYRFLAIDLRDSLGKRIQEIPYIDHCDNHPNKFDEIARVNLIDAMHGVDSIKKANEFARVYNRELAGLLNGEKDAECQLRYVL